MDNKTHCSHLDQINEEVKAQSEGCEECLKLGDSWVSLRKCLTCGHVGCCDSSKNKHASKHFENTKHPIVEEFGGYSPKPFRWCYIDSLYITSLGEK